MNAILKFDFQKKRKQLRFSEVNYLSYTKKDPISHVTTTLSLKHIKGKQEQAVDPFHPLNNENVSQASASKQINIILLTKVVMDFD